MSYRQQYFFGMTLTAILKNLTGHNSVLSSLILNKSLKFCFCEHPTSTYPWVMNWSTYEQKKSKIPNSKISIIFCKETSKQLHIKRLSSINYQKRKHQSKISLIASKERQITPKQAFNISTNVHQSTFQFAKRFNWTHKTMLKTIFKFAKYRFISTKQNQTKILTKLSTGKKSNLKSWFNLCPLNCTQATYHYVCWMILYSIFMALSHLFKDWKKN